MLWARERRPRLGGVGEAPPVEVRVAEGLDAEALLIEITEKRGQPLLGPSDPTLPGLTLLHPDAATLADPPSVNDLSLVLRLVFGEPIYINRRDKDDEVTEKIVAALTAVYQQARR